VFIYDELKYLTPVLVMATEDSETETTFLYELARRGETSELVGYLKRAENPAVRRRAAELLGEFDDVEEPRREEIVQALIVAVEADEDDSVRARAIDALYRHGTETLERLIEDLSGGTVSGESGRETAQRLVEWLDSEHPEFRMVAATALGEIGDERVLPALIGTLDDPDARIRARALRSCGMLGDDRCVPHVRERLNDEYTSVQEAAATALGSIGTERALEALVPVVTSSGTASVRRIAAEELGQFGSLKPLVALVEALQDDSDAVKRAAALSLLQLVSQAPAEHTTQVRETIADQLHGLDDSLVVPPLLDICRETPRTVVRWHAVWFLGRITDHDEAVVDALLDALDSDHDSVARAAASSLEQLGGDEVEKRLRIFTQNDDASGEAIDRAESLLEEMRPDAESEVVTNSIDVTYVREPADYTTRHREDDENGGEHREEGQDRDGDSS